MSDNVQIALIVGAGPTLLGILNFVQVWMTLRAADKAATAAGEVKVQMVDLHTQIDGKMQKLMELRGDASYSEGKAAGVAEERVR